MPALSKKQQKFFGIVRAIQKGEQAPTTPETAKAASDMKKTDVKKFASTKHKGLPNKKVTTEEIKLNRKISFPQMQERIRDAKERARAKKKEKDQLSMDSKRHGVKFYDKKGSGRIKQGKKIYDWLYIEWVQYNTMLSFLLPFASKIIKDAVDKIPEDSELGEKLIDLCLVILGKAVKLTKTDMDDKLLETVTQAIKSR